MNDFITKYGLLDLARVLRLILFIFAGLFVMIDGVALWPLYVLLCLLFPKTLERIFAANLYSKRFGEEDFIAAIYVFANFALFYLLIRMDSLAGALDAVVAINKNLF